ncbi:MAG: DUF4968 domain-containing protein [Leptospiraceae bacterium]|nr:DUF4968 domain-containing protein [Leptospiraceae bacterium]MCP5497826.1 DUF4968 domain-containing protein [Leptospiraceae bacterium]
MDNQLIGKVPLWLVKFVLKKVLRRKMFSYNRVIPPKDWRSFGNIQNVQKEINKVSIELEKGKMQLSFLSPQILRIQIAKKLQDIPKSYAIEETKTINLELLEKGNLISLASQEGSGLIAQIDKTNSQISIKTTSHTPVFTQSNFGFTEDDWFMLRIKGEINNEHFFGLGENAGSLDQRNKTISFWNTDSIPYSSKDENLYQSQPIQVIVREDGFCYALIYDNPFKSQIKIQKQDTFYNTSYFVAGGGINYYIVVGENTHDLFTKIISLLGNSPLPPLSTLGNHQCKWSYYPESQVREIAKNFREKKIPCDFIHLDIDYLDGYRIFTWDKIRFPEPKKLADDLAENGFKLMAMTDPGVKVDPEYEVFQEGVKDGHFCQNPDGTLFTGMVWPGDCHFPDFTGRHTREWFGKHFKVLTDVGIKGFWIDMNEPSVFSHIGTVPDKIVHPNEGNPILHKQVHNVYGHLMAKATYEGLQKLIPNQRIFVLTRAAYLGTQKYSGSWTGDNNADWEHLRYSIPMLMNMASSGQVMNGPDIGGFAGKPKEELLIRWYQAGLFYPFFRNHSINDTCSHEPWKYTKKAENIIKNTIQLRYQLLLYIYNEIRKACQTGIPAFRALWIDYPTDPNVYKQKWADTQYLFGSSILVAPILKKGDNKRKVYLPKGAWFDFWNGNQYDGGRIHTFNAPIDQILLFVKSGSIIPFIKKDIQYTEEIFNSPVTLRLYGETECTGEIYLDDGFSLDYQNEDYELVSIVAKKQNHSWGFKFTYFGKKKKYISIGDVEQIGSNEH